MLAVVGAHLGSVKLISIKTYKSVKVKEFQLTILHHLTYATSRLNSFLLSSKRLSPLNCSFLTSNGKRLNRSGRLRSLIDISMAILRCAAKTTLVVSTNSKKSVVTLW